MPYKINECPACGFNENGWSKLKYSLSEYDVFQCVQCGFIFVEIDDEKNENSSKLISSSVEFHLKSKKRLMRLARKTIEGDASLYKKSTKY